MPKYAQFDHTAASPQPVIGWYDTDQITYPTMPPAADLVTMTDSQWTAHLQNLSGWTVVNGVLIAPS